MKITMLSLSYSAVAGVTLLLFAHGRPSYTPPPSPPPTTEARRFAGMMSAPLPFRNASIELPADGRTFPEGPGAELVNGNCLACHSSGMVLNQPRLSAATWRDEIEKMRHIFLAPVAESEVAGIAAYLIWLQERQATATR